MLLKVPFAQTWQPEMTKNWQFWEIKTHMSEE